MDRTGEREQALLDENGHFADEVHRFAAFLEDARIPFDAIGQFVDFAPVGIRPVLKLAELEEFVDRIWSENSLCLRKYRSIPCITSLRS